MIGHCSFGKFLGSSFGHPDLGQNLGKVLDRIWAWFVHEKWCILGLVLPLIGLIPIGVTQFHL